MVKVVDKQNIFNHGILSPKLYSRDDLKQFNGGVADAMNFICSRYGPMEKRTGTNFIWDLGNPTEKVFFLPFVFSVKQSVLLEFLANRIRFYTFDGAEFGPIAAPGITWQSSTGRVVYTKKEYNALESNEEAYDSPDFEQSVGAVSEIDSDNTLSTSIHISSSNTNLKVVSTFSQTFSTEGIVRETLTAKKVAEEKLLWYSSLTNQPADISADRYKLSIEGTPNTGDVLSLTYTTTVSQAPYIVVDNVKYYRKALQYEIETPFTAEQLDDISYVQSLDVIYLAFADRKTPPYTLSRYANNNWKLDLFVTEDGPYLDKNYATGKKMTIADKNTNTSTVNLTGFTLGANDVGRWIRICTPRYNENTYVYDEKWSYGKIASVATDGKSITVDWSYRNVVSEEDQDWMTKETSEWRLGVWHTGTGNNDYPVTYPTKVTIHQQRLTWAGLTDKPWVWTSNSFAYKNYAPSDYEGEISDTNSISYDISTDKVSDIFWLRSVKSLLIGTELGELRMYSAGTAMTPADVVSNRESSYGSFNAEPVVNDDNIVFIQRLQRTVRSLSYDYNQDSFVGPELTILAEGLTTGGIKKIVFQKEPNNTYWALKEDGTLLTLTYDKSQDVIGWSRSVLAGEDVKVIDLTVLPSNDNGQDMVMFAVERTIGGVTKRYLELLSRNFIRDLKQSDASFLDCSTHIASDEPFNVIDGLDFLEDQTVVVMDEGSYLGEFKVAGGRIILDTECKDVAVGLPYDAYFETLERDFQDRQLSTKMAKLRVYKMYLYVDRTTGLSLHRLERGSETQLITFSPDSNMDTVGELLTGKVNINVGSNWDCDFRLKVNSDPGFPCTVSGIVLGVEINAI